MSSKLKVLSALKGDLKGVAKNPLGNIGNFMRYMQDEVYLLGGESSPLARFSLNGVLIGKSNFSVPLQIGNLIDDRKLDDRKFSIRDILSELDTDSISLNHLGIGMHVLEEVDLDEKVASIVKKISTHTHKVFEDPEGRAQNMRWLFVGLEDNKNPGKPRIDVPMMELVLSHPSTGTNPHFQFDIDTPLTQSQIEQKLARLGTKEPFFNWGLDINEVGRVLSMGTYNNQHGMNFEIGIGNDKRSREAHRNSMIKHT